MSATNIELVGVLLGAPSMRTTGGADCTVALFDLDGAGEKQPASTRYAVLLCSRSCQLPNVVCCSREPTNRGSGSITGFTVAAAAEVLWSAVGRRSLTYPDN